ncbi:hypothetical protein D3C73_999740 [compost metagenome]
MTQHPDGIAIQHAPQIHARRLGPALQGGHGQAVLVANVQGQGDGFGAELLQPFQHLIRIGDGQRADDDAADPGPQQVLDILFRADAAARLDLDVHGLGHVADQRILTRLARLSPVQVDDVDPLGPLGGEGRQPVGGMGVIAGHVIEIAVQQANRMAVDQVNGGIDDHAGSSRKFFRIRAPSAAERSGWNWQPQRLALLTMAGTATP